MPSWLPAAVIRRNRDGGHAGGWGPSTVGEKPQGRTGQPGSSFQYKHLRWFALRVCLPPLPKFPDSFLVEVSSRHGEFKNEEELKFQI